jgi:hypothetical protein
MADLTGREKSQDNEPRQKPDRDATSKDTLSDVQEGQQVSSSRSRPSPGPSPDGAMDEKDETNDAGPM